MKVLILITKSNMGGAQRYTYDLATNLPKNKYEIEVLAGGNGPLIEKLNQAGIKALGSLPVERDVKILGDIKVFFKLIKILREKKPDILHVNSSKIGGLGALAGRIVGIRRIIFTAHGWAFNENRTLISKLVIKFLHWMTICLSHATISVSESLESQMKNWPYIHNKITVVHNAIRPQAIFSKTHARNELGKLHPRLDQIIKSTNIKNLIVIGSVGELHHIKGYKYALEAIKNLKENFKIKNPSKKIIYIVMGEGEERKKMEEDINNLDINDSVLLLGNVPLAFQYLRAFDFFLMPSISEGLPYVLLEAGMAGLPVIATSVGGIPEIIEDMKSGVLIQSKKSKEIEHALEFFITHPKTPKEYSKELNDNVLKNFSIEQMIAHTREVYSL
jgi:glycosyltransferase involved in cell wall biosynthesis